MKFLLKCKFFIAISGHGHEKMQSAPLLKDQSWNEINKTLLLDISYTDSSDEIENRSYMTTNILANILGAVWSGSSLFAIKKKRWFCE